MKNKICQIFCFVAILISILIGFTLWGVLVVPPQFEETYQSVIVRQYDRYKSLGNNKIVLMGTSALAFGCDMDLLEELTGKKCQILGNHAGMATPYFVEMSKCNLQEGDIVIIQYSNYHADSLGTDLLLTAIDNRVDMYQFFRPCNWDDVILDYHNFLSKRLWYWTRGGYHAEDYYASSSFDENGNMIVERIGCEEKSPLDREKIKLDLGFNQDYIDYLNDYISYCEERNVKVFFTVSTALDEWVDATQEECHEWDVKLQLLLNAPLISHRWDYLYPREYMYSLEHCNTIGAEVRTRQLYNDIKKYEEE
ncbi:MAG: hypothetical protein NC313_14985 [Butyrivibrio sp.]|nr:hypothetical protein [Butyrivibrio sp.]